MRHDLTPIHLLLFKDGSLKGNFLQLIYVDLAFLLFVFSVLKYFYKIPSRQAFLHLPGA